MKKILALQAIPFAENAFMLQSTSSLRNCTEELFMQSTCSLENCTELLGG